MKAVMLLPANYVLRGNFDLSKEKGKALLVGLTLASLVLFFAFGLLFLYAAVILVPHLPVNGRVVLDLPGFLGVLMAMLGTTAVVIGLHEAVHGVFYWLFTHERPMFGFKGLYAYAAAPKWYIPRFRFLIVGLAPLVLLTLLGLALLRVIPLGMVPLAVYALTINAAGAVGDLYIVFRLLFAPSACLIHDVGEGIAWYAPEETTR